MAATVLASRQVPASSGSVNVKVATVDFGTAGNQPDSVTVTVTDAEVLAASDILVAGFGVLAGRDADEIEMESFCAGVSNVVAGAFDLTVNNLTGGAEGQYTVRYLIG